MAFSFITKFLFQIADYLVLLLVNLKKLGDESGRYFLYGGGALPSLKKNGA